MPVSKLNCPECDALLRPAKPLPAGKSVKCPKCGASFMVPGQAEEIKKGKPSADRPKSAPPPKSPAAAATPPKKPAYDDDDDGPETYSFEKQPEAEKEPEEDELDDDDEEEGDDNKKKSKKPDLAFMPDLSVKDPRGPAQAAVISPSNILMLAGFCGCVLNLAYVLVLGWPLFFSEHLLDPADVPLGKDKEKDKILKLEWDKVTDEQKTVIEDAIDETLPWVIGEMVLGFVGMAYFGFVIYCGVKMQNLESYTLSMIGAIMAMIPFGAFWFLDKLLPYPVPQARIGGGWVFGGVAMIQYMLSLFAGFLVFTSLRSKKVLDGFFYKGEKISPLASRRKERK
jgi:hypothetical protein